MVKTFAVTVLCAFAAVVAGQDEGMVPFVIPAKQNEGSVIAVQSVAVSGEDDRLIVKDAHFHAADRRVRLWGVNLSFGASLPTHDDARMVARRLAAAGVNTVRCHHMDTDRYPRGWWDPAEAKAIHPEAFDRFDYFVNELAQNGIYIDLNLHVGREHSKYLGLAKSNLGYDKISNIFTPALVTAQKDFARTLLTHRNKYRNMTYAEDPAIAIVEITNENSFFMWSSEDTIRTLPAYYAAILQGKYNQWLVGKYTSTAGLRTAWGRGAQPLGGDLVKNASFSLFARTDNAPKSWTIEQHSGSAAAVSASRYKGVNCIQLQPKEINETEWHLQFNQGSIALQEGRYYTVTFAAAAERARSITCSVSQAHDPWGTLGLAKKTDLTEEFHDFTYGFAAKSSDDNARLSVSFGGDMAAVYLSNVRLRTGGLEGLGEGESLDDKSVLLYATTETQTRIGDRMRFLAETEKAYFDDMRNHIKKDLKSRALVTGTIVFGPLGMYAQSDMDFIDAHAYWQHPRFPNKPWDRNDWLVDQKPMTGYPQEATLYRIAAERLAGKPFTVTEYNHPAPLDSQAECVPMIASFGAAQDWDGIWIYTYSHSSDQWDRRVLASYFDIDTNPAKWGFVRSAAEIFRNGRIEGLPVERTVSIAQDDALAGLVESHLKHDRDMFAVLADKGITRSDMLAGKVGASITAGDSVENLPSRLPELTWDVDGDGKGLYFARGAGAWVLTGHSEKVSAATQDLIRIDSPAFVTLTAAALDGADLYTARHVLITACGRCENTGMKFSADRRTVGVNWGAEPVRIEPVNGTMRLVQGRWKCEALGPDGVPASNVDVLADGDRQLYNISARYGTMWYLLTRLDIQENR